jgi:hypothetical protein
MDGMVTIYPRAEGNGYFVVTDDGVRTCGNLDEVLERVKNYFYPVPVDDQC